MECLERVILRHDETHGQNHKNSGGALVYFGAIDEAWGQFVGGEPVTTALPEITVEVQN